MAIGRKQYPFDLIEAKWQRIWDDQQTFRAWNPGEQIPATHPFARRHQTLPPKYYILDMFPYPSGAGLHVGHPEGYTATDILARYKRARGFNVLHPMGWDAFGLPAEQYAIKTGQHPRQTTVANIATFKRQIKALGFSYDWTREIDTTDPKYFKWTQTIFLKLYDAWFNPVTNRAEPIGTLPYPPEVATEEAKRAFRDSKRLAYVAEAPVNWCPALGTVLSNEEVIDGKSEVGGFPVIRRPMRQWMLRITAFAERLLTDLETIDWSDSLKDMQRNWIGRSEGAEVVFTVADSTAQITVFTTRPDTLFGATYMVLAPELGLVDQIAPAAWPAGTPGRWQGTDAANAATPAAAIRAYRAFTASKSDLERTELAKEKTGVFTGAFAINPVNGERIPIWIADYVLATYGTGAIMAVPAHDARDGEFAREYELPIRPVVQAPAGAESIGFVGDGVAINSGFLTGLPTPEAKKQITNWLEERGVGRKTINYKLRDWLFSRQRYWGEPFPIVWKDGHHEAVSASLLPLLPPEMSEFRPTESGEPPLARAKEWVHLPDGALRETNTMPQWAGSCWYYLRFIDPHNDSAFCDPATERYWMTSAIAASSPSSSAPVAAGVDLYVGGAEHAVLHLLYARFWHKALYDLGQVSTAEPFFKLVNQGLVLGELEFRVYRDEAGKPVSLPDVGANSKLSSERLAETEVEKRGAAFVLKSDPTIVVEAKAFKMSKSRGNVVNPDDILAEYGADAFRLYEMFMGPLSDSKPWNTKGVEGVYRFLGRVWRLFTDETSETEFEQAVTADPSAGVGQLASVKLHPAIQDAPASPSQLKALHACIKKVTEDLEGMRFNTAISALMVFTNEATGWETRSREALRQFLMLLQPLAPHLAEELNARLAGARPVDTLAYEPWPAYDPALLVEATIEIPVQVNGKLRDVIVVASDATPAQIEAAAKASEKALAFMDGKSIKKVVVVPKKLVNIVVG